MSYKIHLSETPAGYALENAAGVEGHPVRIATREFISSEDGELFIERLEGWPTHILSMLPRTEVDASTINHLLVVIAHDLTATVYVNELPIMIKARSTRTIMAGEGVRESDFADITEMKFGNIEIQQDTGILIVFSVEWRKGLFYDFDPLQSNQPRTYDLPRLLGSYYAYLMNQAVFRLNEDDWNFLITQSWFPFISLRRDLLKTLIGRARGRIDLDVLIPKIREYVASQLPAFLERWKLHPLFVPHKDLLEHAAAEFRDGDFISATAIIYPRIEGLMRDLHIQIGAKEKASQAALAERLVEGRKTELHPYSWLLPDLFKRYLKEAYFADFQPGVPAKLSRNSVGHGVATAAAFNEKAATIGFLIIDQVSWFLPEVTRKDG
jgi:hypothetical protein